MSAPGTEPQSLDDAPYRDGLDHLADVLDYVRALLTRYLGRRRAGQPQGDALAGFAVDDSEIERFLAGPDAAGAPDDTLAAIRGAIDGRVAASRAAGIDLPLPSLFEAFGLSSIEQDVVSVLLAPELDPAFERAYAYAWNDFTRKTADLGFVLDLVSSDFRGRCEAALLFSPTEPLRWNGLVEVDDGSKPIERGFLTRPIRLAQRVVSFLLGEPAPDLTILPYADVIECRGEVEDFVLQPEALEPILRAVRLAATQPGARLVLRGPPGCGKKHILQAILAEQQMGVLVLDLASLIAGVESLERALRAARREASLRRAALYLDFSGFEVADDLQRRQHLTIERCLDDFPGLVVLAAAFPVHVFGGPRGGVIDVPIPIPEAEQREALWQSALRRPARLAKGTELGELARQYPLTGGAILSAGREAISRARRRSLSQPLVTRTDLVDSARRQLTGRLSALATRITTSLDWADLVLPDETMDRLRELTAYAKHRKKVFEQWGFGALLPYGRGLSALFHGPPGTGKTMVAGIIAGQLGMDLFRVDLSQIVSKYVGETEKNLGRIFDEAGQSHSVLLFDEADSLFAKRTEVKSATDRYANLEVNYLLQRMEAYEGVTILTTNFEKGVDDAFKRRIRFRVAFPFPDIEDRDRLWRAMMPPGIPVGDEIMWDELAYDYELSGGHIKNAILRAAFVAAERDDVLTNADLRAAAALECKEIGKLVRDWPDEEL